MTPECRSLLTGYSALLFECQESTSNLCSLNLCDKHAFIIVEINIKQSRRYIVCCVKDDKKNRGFLVLVRSVTMVADIPSSCIKLKHQRLVVAVLILLAVILQSTI